MAILHTTAAAALGALAAAVNLSTPSPVASAIPSQVPSAPCYNGIAPINPYIANCAIPYRPPHVRGGAPDQTALLNCGAGSAMLRGLCLSAYVNGGVYPGFVGGPDD
jgi:hypothetical protein